MTKKSKGKKSKAVLVNAVLTYTGPAVHEQDDLATLERKFDLAGARLTYAVKQEVYWKYEAHKRSQAFNDATVAYKSKKHGFTDDDIKNDLPASTSVWSCAK